MNTPQPPVTNYNRTRVLWTQEQCEYLIDQRITRNIEFWSLGQGNQRPFWISIAEKINECFGTRFTSYQVASKWKNLKKAHEVSIFYTI